jgi:formate/nitrite transporter
MQNFSTPAEIAAATIEVGLKKAALPWARSFVLAILAGAFIAFAAEGSNMAAFNLFAKADTYGLGKALAGAVFPTGLMLVVIAGGELFTGNTLMCMGLAEGRLRLGQVLWNWCLVYAGNLLGSLLIAHMMAGSGLFSSGANMLGGVTIRIAAYKTGLDFTQALYLGIMCNWLVCLAVWLAYGAKDIVSKCFGIFFPICLFITSGFEHSVANMYYIPAGIFAKANAAWVTASGVAPEVLANLNWQSFFVQNLLPVTLGNIIGGGLFVGIAYWFAYKK